MTSGFQPDPFISEWLARLAANGMLSQSALDDWASRGTEAGLTLFEHLGAGRRKAVRASLLNKDTADNLPPALTARLPSMLLADALAIDLESDGENTWEVGITHAGETRLLHDRGSEAQLHSAMTALHTMVRDAPLVIGHNLLAWDWPIIQRFAPDAPPPLVWDTLLVSFLLDPQAPTHALGGAHHAEHLGLVKYRRNAALAHITAWRARLDPAPRDHFRGRNTRPAGGTAGNRSRSAGENPSRRGAG
jgi:hypothetical protein